MTQIERLDYLIESLLKESDKSLSKEIKDEDKSELLSYLMNVRMPKAIDHKFLTVQDKYLKQALLDKGIIKLDEIPTIKEEYSSDNAFSDKLSVWQGDITTLEVGAIVNAANSQLLGCFIPVHRCIDNAIHSAAGVQLREECNKYMQTKKLEYRDYEEPTGSAMITSSYNLPSSYVIHTVGPIVSYNLTDKLRKDLRNSYKESLEIALKNEIKSIAFCCISTGEFNFPNDEAAKIAIDTVTDFIDKNPNKFDRIIFNVFKNLDEDIYKKLLK